MDKNDSLALDHLYPLPFPAPEGIAVQFHPAELLLQIMLPNLTLSEEKILQLENIQVGLIVDQPVLIFVVQCGRLIFECPINAWLLKVEEFLKIPPSSLLMTIHVIDTATKLLKIVRHLSLPRPLTHKLYQALQEQIALQKDDCSSQYAQYAHLKMAKLVEMAELSVCREDVFEKN